MTLTQIKEFYRAYKSQILAEMQEYLDMPLSGIEKGYTQYRVFEKSERTGQREVSAIYTFRLTFPSSNQYFDVQDDTRAWTLNWGWDEVGDQVKTPQNFLRVLASGYQVLADFINNRNPDLVSFSGLTKGHESIYTGETFLKRLKTLFGRDYDIITDKENSVVHIVKKAISKLKKEAIAKRAQQTTLLEAETYWKYPHLHPSTLKTTIVKQAIKKKVLEVIYLKKLEAKKN